MREQLDVVVNYEGFYTQPVHYIDLWQYGPYGAEEHRQYDLRGVDTRDRTWPRGS